MDQILFSRGTLGYHTCRIPALLALPGSRVLAFCEGRADWSEDHGRIDILMRSSDDGGETWSEPRVIARNGTDTIGNPCPVYVKQTGRIFLFLNTNRADGPEEMILKGLALRGVGYISSEDMGESWSAYTDLTNELKRPDWTWYAVGPGHALEMESGRIVIPCNHAFLQDGEHAGYRAHVILSDDRGKSWRLGATVEGFSGNEATCAELPGGILYLNCRRMDGSPNRLAALSCDGGEHWDTVREERDLPDPSCEGSVIADPARPGVLYFANEPHPPTRPAHDGRRDLSIRVSTDGGAHWGDAIPVPGARHSAYSDLAITEEGKMLVLFENGEEEQYEKINLFHAFRHGRD